MVTSKVRDAASLLPLGKGRVGRAIAARLGAVAMWKVVALGLALIAGIWAVGAAAMGAYHRIAGSGVPSPGVTLQKITGLGEFHAVRADYTVNYTDVVHPGFWIFTGESIHVAGSGSDDGVVNLLPLRDGSATFNGRTAVLLLPHAHLGTPVIDMRQTTLSESGGLFTSISHLFNSDPNDAKIALADAQARITAKARAEDLTGRAEADTREFFTSFLENLGYTKVTVIFA